MPIIHCRFPFFLEITVAAVEDLPSALPAVCLVGLQQRRHLRFLLLPLSAGLELPFVLGILPRAAVRGGIADAPGGKIYSAEVVTTVGSQVGSTNFAQV